MTILGSNMIDTIPLTNLRVGIKWDPIIRDNIAELHEVESAAEARRIVAKIPGQLKKLSLFAELLRATYFFRKFAAGVDATIQYRLSEKKDMEKYLAQAVLRSYDLDLCCFCYDKNAELVGFVIPDVTEMHGTVQWNQAFLHSGNDTTGTGDAFDEELLIRLPLVETAIHQMFVVVVSVNYGFDKIKGSFCSIIQTKDERELLSSVLETTEQHRVFVMAKITRNESSWRVQKIGKFQTPPSDKNASLPRRISQLLTALYGAETENRNNDRN